MKKKIFCYGCEQEFIILSTTEGAVEFCPFCGIPLDDDNHDNLETTED